MPQTSRLSINIRATEGVMQRGAALHFGTISINRELSTGNEVFGRKDTMSLGLVRCQRLAKAPSIW